jgi:hypothetical protein
MAANGIKRIHIFPGGTIGPVLDIVHDWNIEILTTRHEQAAGYAALGTAKLTGSKNFNIPIVNYIKYRTYSSTWKNMNSLNSICGHTTYNNMRT